MNRGTTLGLLVGLLLGNLISPLRAQEPWPATEVCNDELLADYARREELIFDLVAYMHECRWRYGGCAPDSTWVQDETNRRWLAAHPEIVQRQREEREAWYVERTRELVLEEEHGGR